MKYYKLRQIYNFYGKEHCYAHGDSFGRIANTELAL